MRATETVSNIQNIKSAKFRGQVPEIINPQDTTLAPTPRTAKGPKVESARIVCLPQFFSTYIISGRTF